VDDAENLPLTDVSGAKLVLEELAWDKQNGLLPAIVQDAATLRVLMLGFMDRDALRLTLDTRKATFFSRTRQRLWTKGETSGNALDVVSIACDCDRDTLLILAHPLGPTCHLGTPSCFQDAPDSMFAQLDSMISSRERERPAGSYTTSLFDAGIARIAQKVGEEGVEVALAAVTARDAQLVGEAADLVYHLTVLLRARGLGLRDVEATLAERHQSRRQKQR
jgi:phosphoribosyl-ATP pyrophosphohydrolase/phosphoribosyl-AMP cyclohydrolase